MDTIYIEKHRNRYYWCSECNDYTHPWATDGALSRVQSILDVNGEEPIMVSHCIKSHCLIFPCKLGLTRHQSLTLHIFSRSTELKKKIDIYCSKFSIKQS